VDDLSEAETQAETAERLLHGSSFGAAAAAYGEHRPGYAEAAVRWALEPALARPPSAFPARPAGDVGRGVCPADGHGGAAAPAEIAWVS